jgi:hypothetical protein
MIDPMKDTMAPRILKIVMASRELTKLSYLSVQNASVENKIENNNKLQQC